MLKPHRIGVFGVGSIYLLCSHCGEHCCRRALLGVGSNTLACPLRHSGSKLDRPLLTCYCEEFGLMY